MTEPRLLGGRYELGAVLGRGGMAEVHEGHDIRLGRTVAIKTLRADLARDHTFQARFRREAQSAASLTTRRSSRSTTPARTTSATAHVPYIVMEYVEGHTLRELLHSGEQAAARALAGDRPPACCGRWTTATAHGIVHRDIKPANVMLTPRRRGQGHGLRHRPRGGATPGDHDADRRGHRHRAVPLARAGPRRARSTPAATSTPPAACSTSCSPSGRRSSATRRSRWPTSTSARSRSRRRRTTPRSRPTIDAIVLQALAKDPDYRYQSADEMRADIERAMRGEQVAAIATQVHAAGDPDDRPAVPPPSAGRLRRGGVPPVRQASLVGEEYDDAERSAASGTAWAIGILTVILLARAGLHRLPGARWRRHLRRARSRRSPA